MKNIISSIYCRLVTVLNLNICKCRFCEFYNNCDISEKNLNKICQLLQCDISDVVEYKEP